MKIVKISMKIESCEKAFISDSKCFFACPFRKEAQNITLCRKSYELTANKEIAEDVYLQNAHGVTVSCPLFENKE